MKGDKIWLSPPHLTGNEIVFIQDAFDQNWVSPYGSNIDEFEAKLEKYFGVPDVALVNSGTAAIHLSLVIAGVGPGDEVIVPTLNFAGCINPILYLGATPLFIDSESDTWNIDPELAEETIKARINAGKKPKAIIAVHLFGVPCKLAEILEIGQRYDIPVIEDSADALGSTYKGSKAGTLGLMGIISFNGNKIITTSGGGALISSDAKLVAMAKHLSNQARKLEPYYVHDAVGYNYMMSNILAGIGNAQMDVLDDRLIRRKAIYCQYKQELGHIEELEFQEDQAVSESNRWLSTVLIRPKTSGSSPNRDEVYRALASENIETRPVWNPMHLQPAFQSYPFFGSNLAESLFNHGLCLPSGSGMTEEQFSRLIEAMRRIFKDVGVRKATRTTL